MTFFRKNKKLLYCIAVLLLLIAARIAYTHTLRFSFLFWNIFLALLPLYFSHQVSTASKPYLACISALLWLLFFPNAAYLFTDIVHLQQSTHLIFWVDMVILYLAGIYGIYIGMLSLKKMESWYGKFLSLRGKTMVTLLLLLLCGYGIYLGRVERWNSWDVVAQPEDLLRAMFHHSRHPVHNREVWEMTFLFGGVLALLYQLFGRVQDKKTTA